MQSCLFIVTEFSFRSLAVKFCLRKNWERKSGLLMYERQRQRLWTFLCIFFERFNCTGDNVKKKIFKIYHHIRRIKNKSLFKLHFFFTIFLFLKILFCTNKFEVLKRRIRSRNRTITFCISYFLNHMVYELYRFYVFLPAKRFFSISNSLKLYFLYAVRLFSRIFQNEKTHFHYRRRPF